MHRPGPATALAVLITAALFVTAFGVALAPPASAQSTVNVSIKGFAFNPAAITVVIGENSTVTWTNQDSVTHTVTSDTGAFNSGDLSSGQTFTHTFTTPGTYSYHCSIHTYMQGVVTVEAAGGASTTSSISSTTAASSSTTTSSSSTTTSSESTAPTSSTTSTPTTSATPSSSGGGIPEFPYQGALVAVITLALIASYYVMRLSNKSRLQK